MFLQPGAAGCENRRLSTARLAKARPYVRRFQTEHRRRLRGVRERREPGHLSAMRLVALQGHLPHRPDGSIPFASNSL